MWNGSFFEGTSFKLLGLRVQLGHSLGDACPHPSPATDDDFVVIDADGVHNVALNYCGCQKAAPQFVQLLRARLFPATVTQPKTAATFRALETYQMLSNVAKVSGYDFVMAVTRRMDNTSPAHVRVRP